MSAVQALTEPQTQFLYYVDVVGTSIVRASELAGITAGEARSLLQDPNVAHVRAVQKDLARHRSRITIDDVNEGILDAVETAKLIADPTAQIRGWVELARINGLDAPKKVFVEHSIATPDSPSEQLRTLPTADLVRLMDEEATIDVDFIEHKP